MGTFCDGQFCKEKETEKENEEPLINSFHSHVVISQKEDDKPFEELEQQIQWNENNPMSCLTIKPTMLIDPRANGNENLKLRNANLNNDLFNEVEEEYNLDIFDKIKTIEEADPGDNYCIIKSSKT